MTTTTRNSNVGLSILLCAVILHALTLAGFAQATNQVLSLDGSSGYVSVPSAADLETGELTIEAWIYPTQVPNDQLGSFLNKSDGLTATSQRTYEVRWLPYNNLNFAFFLVHVDGLSDAAALGVPVMSNRWTHVAAAFSSSAGSLQIYTNGVLAAWDTGSNAAPIQGRALRQTTLPVVFGWTPSFANDYASGYMDEVHIWNVARSAQDIYANVFCRLTGKETNLAGYWNFDGGTANDLTGHGHNGTFMGTAQAVPIVGGDAVHAGVCGAVLHRTATASLILTNDFVVGAIITDGGYGYTNTPTVRIIGGGGSGAQAVALVSNGVVTSITVTNAGYGYTNTPLIVIDPPFIPNPVLSIAPMSFLAFSNLTVGGVYQLQRSVAWYWSNQPVSFTATNALYAQLVAGVAGSADYRLALNPVPVQAFAAPEVTNGFVIGAMVTSGGSGYGTSPAVTIVGGGGTNAGAVANISAGVVTSITITNAGIGYTNTPTIRIAPPPAAAVSPTVSPVMRVDSANLAPYDNYQIQFELNLGGTWVNWTGGSFSPTGETNSQYLFITDGAGLFRVRYVP